MEDGKLSLPTLIYNYTLYICSFFSGYLPLPWMTAGIYFSLIKDMCHAEIHPLIPEHDVHADV